MLVIRLVVLINSKFSLPQDTSYDLSAVVYSILLKGIVLIIKESLSVNQKHTWKHWFANWQAHLSICLRVLAMNTPVNKIAWPVFPNMVVTFCQPEDGSFVMQMRFEVAWFEKRGGRVVCAAADRPAMCVYFEDKIEDMNNSSCILLQKLRVFTGVMKENYWKSVMVSWELSCVIKWSV